MTRIQLGFCMPGDSLDKEQRATFVADLNRVLELVTGYFDSAWMIDHLCWAAIPAPSAIVINYGS